MAELTTRNTNAQSVCTILAFARSDEFLQRTRETVSSRLERLVAAWRIFQEMHNELVQIATENERADEVRLHETLFREIEEAFMDANGILSGRIREIDRNAAEVLDNLRNDNLSESENSEVLSVNDNSREEQNDEQNRDQLPPNRIQPHQDDPMARFGAIVQRMCTGISSKKENTWGDFDGNLSKWQGFRDSFKSAVHEDDLIAPVYKFQLLKSSLKGRAAKAFGEWQINDQNYLEAWEWLNEMFSRPYATSKIILWKLMNFRKMEKTCGFLIEKLVNETQQVVRQLKAMNYPVHRWDGILVHVIHDKLDGETSKNWELNRKSEEPTVKDMLDFLTPHGRALASAQIYEQKLHGGKRHASETSHKSESKKAKFDTSAKTKSFEKFGGQKCKVCKKDPHPIYGCKELEKLNVADRKKKVRELDLCFNCFSSAHRVSECPKRNCERCEIKRNSFLCPENPKNKKTINTVQSNGRSKKDRNKPKKWQKKQE